MNSDDLVVLAIVGVAAWWLSSRPADNAPIVIPPCEPLRITPHRHFPQTPDDTSPTTTPRRHRRNG